MAIGLMSYVVLLFSQSVLSNLLLALLFTAGLFVAVRSLPGPLEGNPLILLLGIGLQLTVLLAIFNLVPSLVR